MVRRGHGVCTSISFNFHARCRIEIRFSDNPQQKDTVGDIIWGRRKKYVIYRLDILFSISHVVQSMVSKINLFCQKDICRYPKRDIGRKNQTSYHVRKLKKAMLDCFYVTLDWDIWRNCSLYLQKRVKFQAWAKMFFYQI